MSGTRAKRRGAIAGLAFGTLSLLFNSQAQADPAQPVVPDAPNPVTMTVQAPVNDNVHLANPQTFRAITNQRLVTQVEELFQAAQGGAEPQELNRHIDDIMQTVRNGGDPNQRLTQLPNTITTLMVIVANELSRPEIIEELIQHGADLNQTDGRNMLPIDYALLVTINAQNTTRSRIEASFEILDILARHGVNITDSTRNEFQNVTSYRDLVRNLVAMDVLRERGDVTRDEYEQFLDGPQPLREAARTLTTLSSDWLRANGATLLEYPEALPGAPEPYRVRNGDTWDSLARRFMEVLGAPDEDTALQILFDANNVGRDASGAPDTVLAEGDIIHVPAAPDFMLGYVRPGPNQTIDQLATQLLTVYPDPNATAEDVIRTLMRMNGLTRDELENLPPNTTLMTVFQDDSYTHMPQLTPPSWAQPGTGKTTLIIIEGEGSHGRKTYRVAVGTNYAINPDINLENFIRWDSGLIGHPDRPTSDAQRIVLDLLNNPLRDNIVFTHSMVQSLPRINHQAFRNDKASDLVQFELLRLRLERLNESRPIIFTSSGNDHPEITRDIQSFFLTHSPRSLLVGAIGRYGTPLLGNGEEVIAPYSSLGGEICAILPTEIGRQMEGTSFSTPLLAAVYRQFSDWYGDTLSYEEIMAAAMMTASRDILELDPVNGYYLNTPFGRVAVPAPFRTNGGGLGFNERCGPGNIDFELWNETLKRMVAEKQARGGSPELQSHMLDTGEPVRVETDAEGNETYVYEITIPEDMTLGRLTFMVPQERGAHGEVTVRTPSGFTVELPHAVYDTVSTHAFAYEDVRAGDVIEIRTDAPLGAHAGMMLRGHADGNVIQTIREHLRTQGILPAPLTHWRGDQEVPSYPPPSEPITESAVNDNIPGVPEPEENPAQRPAPILPRSPGPQP